MAKKSVLGRGLNALMDGSEDIINRRITANVLEVDISSIETNPWQPRSNFDDEKLNELAASIKEHGIIQPLTLRKVENEKFQIIAGERRLKAAQIVGLNKVPAFVRKAEDDIMLELALIENIQREDLNPIEIAISYQRLIEECKLTQENLSDRVGKKRSTVTNYLRLLKLPPEIQLGIREQKISIGQAKVIINITEQNTQLDLYDKIVREDLTVRKIEELVRNLENNKDNADGTYEDDTEETVKENEEPTNQPDEIKPSETTSENIQNGDYEKLKDQLSGFFQTNIVFSRNLKGKGKIVIPFQSDEELEKIIAILDKANI